MAEKFVAPAAGKASFHCPHCGVYSHQIWWALWARDPVNSARALDLPDWQNAACTHCKSISLWLKDRMIYPMTGSAPLPNDDLPADILADYNEARDIASRSPRGAAALLRLAIQKLCKHLGGTGGSINDDIAKMVAGGLPTSVQKSLDAVRVIGNEAVHPGTLDLKDDLATVAILFHLVNFIADKTISDQKQIDAIYGMLPADKVKAIEARDKKA